MAEARKLTKPAVDRIAHPTDGQTFYWDAELRGFGLRVGAEEKAYVAQGRVRGRTVRVTIGKHGVFTPDEARKLAKRILGDIAKGIDPNEVKAEQRAHGVTLRQLYEEFGASRKGLKAKTVYEYDRMMRVYFGNWHTKPVRDILPALIEHKHAELGETSHAQANLAMRFLRSLLNYGTACTMASGKPLIESNPVTVLTKKKLWYRIRPRTSYIKPTELAEWWRAVESLGNETLRDYLRLVLLTGLRRNEAERLEWRTVDLKARTLTVPDTKNRRDHTLPLSDFLTEILVRRKASAGDAPFVFPGSGATGHIVEPKKQLAKVISNSGIDFSIHDLRRTFASIVNSLEKTLPYYTIKRLLNHSLSGDVTASYVQHDVEQLRAGMQAITDYVLKAANVRESAAVVKLNAASR